MNVCLVHEIMNDESVQSSTYFVENLSDGSVCLRLVEDPSIFSLGLTTEDAMRKLTKRLVDGSIDNEVAYPKNVELEIFEAFQKSDQFQQALFAFKSYQHGYNEIGKPFSDNKSFVLAHAVAGLYFKNPTLLITGFILILMLIGGLFVTLVTHVSDFLMNIDFDFLR